MSYIQQSGNGADGSEVQHGNVITGTYEVHSIDEQVDAKDPTNVILLEQQQQQQQQQPQQQNDTTNNTSTTLDNGQSSSATIGGANVGGERYIERTTRSKSHSNSIVVERTSNRFPSLKQYFTFGPWVGRNRKAQCMACEHQSCSSQPDRLLKHLKKCTSLSDEDKLTVEEMINERSATKKRRVAYAARSSDNEGDSPYYDDDNNISLNTSDRQIVPLVMGTKRVKSHHSDKKAFVDEALTKFIMINRIPLKSIHSKEFIEFVRALDPDYKLPTRDHITTVLIPGLLNII